MTEAIDVVFLMFFAIRESPIILPGTRKVVLHVLPRKKARMVMMERVVVVVLVKVVRQRVKPQLT